MHATIHRAGSRGLTETDWLTSRHSFSFGEYYDPERINFAAIRVLNDDTVAAGEGFGTHPHRDMEIISIPLAGALEHKDSTGATGVLRPGKIQVMSAGAGIRHSEYNHSQEDPVSFLQIWITPARTGFPPRYDEKDFDVQSAKNALLTIITPEKTDSTLWLNQDAHLSLASLDANASVEYRMQGSGHGLYVFVIDGAVRVGEHKLGKRDAIGISEFESVAIVAGAASELLLIEVPMP